MSAGKGEAMNGRHRTNDPQDRGISPDESVQAEANVDSDNDTEAHGGKIFIRSESHADDVADRESQPSS